MKELAKKLGFRSFYEAVPPGAELPQIREALANYIARDAAQLYIRSCGLVMISSTRRDMC